MNRSIIAQHLAAAFILSVVLLTPLGAQKRPYGNKERGNVRIYVSAAEKSTADSAAELKRVLAQAHFTVVDSPKDANFSVQVEHGYMPAGTLTKSRRTGGFSSRMSPDDVAAVRLTLEAGDSSTTIIGTSLSGAVTCHCHPYGTWTEAAVTAESQLDTWVQTNYDHLVALQNSGK